MRQSLRKASRIVWLFLLVPVCLVYCLGPASPAFSKSPKQKSGSPKSEIYYGAEKLPAPVQDMREAILTAVKSGRIEDLRHAFELNELKPDLGPQAVADPVAHWRQLSGDGQGWELLAALGEVLEAGYVALPLGRDPENNRIYVWPYFAEVPLDKLTPTQEVELLRLVPAAAAKEMKSTGRYTYWRVVIGADGTWHAFRKP